MHALIEFKGKQFKVEEGDSLKVHYIKGKVGNKVILENVLYFEDDKTKTVGKPFIKGKTIDAKIVSHGKSRKVVVFKFKRRKGYQVKNTHRDDYTILQFGKLSSTKKKVTPKKTKAVTAKKVSDKKTAIKTKSVKKEKE